MPDTKDRGKAGDIWLTLPDGSEHALREDLTIGRGEDNDLILRTTTVSRQHARLTHRDGRWFIEDRGSRNGTFVNGKRIPAGIPFSLHHADRIDVGSDTLVFAWLTESADAEETQALDAVPAASTRPLSPSQQQDVA